MPTVSFAAERKLSLEDAKKLCMASEDAKNSLLLTAPPSEPAEKFDSLAFPD
jgi:hypothetical protein